MTSKMRRLAQRTVDLPGVELVSFTVDPDYDQPPVLRAFGQKFQADFRRWHFLTGPRATLHQLGRESFLLNDVDGSLEHSTRFALVDKRGVMRGAYQSESDEEIEQAYTSIVELTRETEK
jgi:protein SCO1/2